MQRRPSFSLAVPADLIIAISERKTTIMWIASIVAAFRTWKRYRATVRQLSQLDNRALQDIGVNRSEIERVAWLSVKA